MSLSIDSSIALAAILKTANSTTDPKLSVGDIYENYSILCQKLAQPRHGQITCVKTLQELDSIGFIILKVISKGKYGRTIDIIVPDWLRPPKKIKEIQRAKEARDLLIRRGDFIREKGLYTEFYKWCSKREKE